MYYLSVSRLSNVLQMQYLYVSILFNVTQLYYLSVSRLSNVIQEYYLSVSTLSKSVNLPSSTVILIICSIFVQVDGVNLLAADHIVL